MTLTFALIVAPAAAPAAEIWTGPRITFVKADSADPTLAANQDRITTNVWLTRGNTTGPFNARQETIYTASSPADTEWANGTTTNLGSLSFTDWFTWAKTINGGPPSTVGVDAVLHLKTDDIYLDIKFTAWSDGHLGAGGFAYERSTPSSPASPPSVAITNLANGTTLTTATNVAIEAEASDTDGTVARVEFFDGSTSLGTDTTSPFSVSTDFYPGTHALTAVATDDSGLSATSAVVTVTVNTVILSNPIAERVPKGDITIELQTVADGMASPLGLAVPDDGSGRLFVYDQSGVIWVVTSAGRQAAPLLDVRSRIVPATKYDYDERGLLGMATHPDFAQHPFIYTYTSESNAGPADFPAAMDPGTSPNHQSVIAEWRIDAANTNRVDSASRRGILRIDEPQANHNSGTMRFGPDGFLYVTLGDGGQANDAGNGHVAGGNAQDTMSILGKVLRLDVDGTNAANGQYGVPADNPLDGTNGLREIWAYGVRNPFAFSFDRLDGTLYLADVGQNKVEEIDRITKGGNFGWNIREGGFWFDGEGNVVTAPVRPVPPDLIDPIAMYDHDDGSAVIGGYVYRGTKVSALQGRYVFADWGSFDAPSGRLFYLDTANQVNELRLGSNDRPLGLWVKGFGEGPDGELYVFGSRVVGPAGNTGKMLRIIPGPEPLQLTSVRTTNVTDAVCDWTGGLGPFALQKKTSVSGPTWINSQISTQTVGLVSSDTASGFFRIADTGRQPAIPFSVVLSGAAERPTPLTNTATGFGLLSLDGNTLAFNIRYDGLSGAATAAHFHGPAATTNNAGVLIDLSPYNGGAFGSNGAVSGTIVLSDAQKALFLSGQMYVNFHTASKPAGEMRGQVAPVLMQASLEGANERPTPVTTSARGLGLFTLVGDQLSFNLTYRGLSGPATGAHIHGPAPATGSAGVLVSLAPFNGGAFGVSGTLAGTITLTPEQLAAVIDGQTYVNFHTAANGGGEIRGQLVPEATAVPFTAPLTGLAERPTPLTNTAAGDAFLSLEGDTLTFSIRYGGLSSAATAAHIHGAAFSTNNTGVQISLTPFNGGAWDSSGTVAGTVVLTPAQRDMLLNGQTYVNFHTAANPAGEMRGQVAPVLMRAYLSGAEERPNPVVTAGNALANFALVLDRLSLAVTYRDLSAGATGSHIHGPAAVNQTAGVQVDLSPYNGGAFGIDGSLVGAAVLTPAQRGSLVDQQTYVNIHTGNFPGGEIRGQITR